MKNFIKLLGIIALVAVIGFVAACSNGSTGGPGSNTPRPVVPLKETYVSYDADGNKYELVITENTTGRALDPNKIYIYKLTITFTDGKVAISTGVAELKTIKDDEGNLTIESIDLKHTDTGITITVTVSSSDDSRDNGDFAIESVSDGDNIPIDNDNDKEVKDVPIPATSYRFNDTIDPNGAGIGWILIKGKVLSNGVAAPIPEKLFDNQPVIGIGWAAFANNKDLRSITIPASITHIGWWGNFENCTNLTTVTFAPNSKLEHIGGGAFIGCTSLSAIEIPASVISIDSWGSFYGCTSLKTVTFAPGSQLKNIGPIDDYWASTFSECTSLTSITIPASVTSIGIAAFEGCTSLKTVNFETGSKLETIAMVTFSGCTSLESITIPASVTFIHPDTGWEDPFCGCVNLSAIYVDSSNPNYSSESGILLNRAKTEIIHVPKGISGSVSVPASVTEIGWWAFLDCAKLTGITIPASVTNIRHTAFQRCNRLTNITVAAGNSNYSSENGILYNKDKTELVTYPSAKGNIIIPTSVTEIGWGAFEGCDSITGVTIHAGVTYISWFAFNECTSITNITIPADVMYIGLHAFNGWTASQTINIQGHANQQSADNAWGSYDGENWRTGCNAKINYNG